LSEQKPKKRPGSEGRKFSGPRDVSGEVLLGWDKNKRTGTKPIPSGSRIPPEAKDAAKKVFPS